MTCDNLRVDWPYNGISRCVLDGKICKIEVYSSCHKKEAQWFYYKGLSDGRSEGIHNNDNFDDRWKKYLRETRLSRSCWDCKYYPPPISCDCKNKEKWVKQ